MLYCAVSHHANLSRQGARLADGRACACEAVAEAADAIHVATDLEWVVTSAVVFVSKVFHTLERKRCSERHGEICVTLIT